MRRGALTRPRRVLMTLDAVGGVWRYSIDLARALGREGIECLLVGCGPEPSDTQRRECDALDNFKLLWTRLPLDWMVEEEAALAGLGDALLHLTRDTDADLLHLNLPSQAAGMSDDIPLVVAAHSCVATWWAAVKGTPLPQPWHWQRQRTARGLARADAVMVPSRSHGDAVTRLYKLDRAPDVVPNAAEPCGAQTKERLILAAGRWWDEAKDARTLDAAAARTRWPVTLVGPLEGPNGVGTVLHYARSLGSLSAEAVRAQTARAAIFVSTSVYEPFGLAVLEAAASGAALVLSDIPTFRELWDEAALFALPGDAAGFARLMNHLSEDHELRESLAERARLLALDFLPARQAEHVCDVYQRALAARAPAMTMAR
jgi:glycosyltransferase involved in cell wall biosynthesis